MKEQILKLRSEGKTFNEIKEILGCSKGTISYHCSDGQKEKSKNRLKKRRENLIVAKLENFKYKKTKEKKPRSNNKKRVDENIRKFQKRELSKINKNIKPTFNWVEVIDKFGQDTHCYLSGEKVNLFENNYNFDHIIPASRGGNNSIDNLGILHHQVNMMKSDLTPDEFIEWCIKILKFNGYRIIKQ